MRGAGGRPLASAAVVHVAIDEAHRKSVHLRRRSRRTKEKPQGTPQNIYVRWIKDEIEQEEACLELPFTMLLLLSFAITAIAYLNQDTISLLENAVETDIIDNANFAWAYSFGHKGLDDVNSYADFWSWNRLGLLPLIFTSSSWPYSEALDVAVPRQDGLPAYNTAELPGRRDFAGYDRPTPIKGDYLRFNRIIGGLRYRQQVAPVASFDTCKYPGQANIFRGYVGKPCIETRSGIDEELDPDSYATEVFEAPVREEWLLSEIHTQEILTQHIIDMEDGCASATAQNRTCLCKWCSQQKPNHPWLSETTTRTEISFMVYNAHYGIHLLATVNFWFNRAGHIHKRVHMRSTWAGVEVRDPGTMFVFLVMGIFWVFSNIYVFRNEGMEMLDTIRRTGKRWYLSIVEDYLGFWNCVDWTSLAIAVAICYMFAMLVLQTYHVNRLLGDFAALTSTGKTPTAADYQESVKAYYTESLELFNRERTLRFALCLYPMVLVLRLFKSFAAQPRLAVVTETFKVAASDLLHFFIVFSSVYVCMSVNAVLFFGQDDINFSRLDWALFSVWRAMLGDVDWDGMRAIGREKAFIWFFLFSLLVVVIVLNILISIIMDSYSTVKHQSENADSLFYQVYELIRRARETRQGKRVKLNDIMEALLHDAEGIEQDMMTCPRVLLPVFRVVLDRRDGQPLGLELAHDGPKTSVKSVLDHGLVEQHNMKHPLYKIRCGDIVLAVNDAHGSWEAIAAEVEKHEVLTIRLRRVPLKALPDDDATPSRPNLSRQNQGSLGSGRKSLTGVPVKTEPAFLMDMVDGVPERQAKRTLKNAQDAHEARHADDFQPEMIHDAMEKLIHRSQNTILCSRYLNLKMQEYATEEQSRSASTASRKSMQEAVNGSPEFRKGIVEAREVTQQHTAELAEDVASVLGEEMAAMERRQKEQQRAMLQTRDSLGGLRQMVYKLDVTCEEVGSTFRDVSYRCHPRGAESVIMSEREVDMDDPKAIRARFLAGRAKKGSAKDASRFAFSVGGNSQN